jgi:hypothetical protein
MQWFKLYWEIATDPKVMTMPEVMRWRLVSLYALCCQAEPSTLDEREIAHWMGIRPHQLAETKAWFVAKRFIEPDWSVPHFAARQAPTDPGAAERMRNLRRRRAEQAANVQANVQPNGPRTFLARDEIRGEQSRGEKKREGAPSPRNVREQDAEKYSPEAIDIARHAAELGGSAEWSAWALAMINDGYRPAWIREALHRAASKRRLDMAYAEGILRKYQDNGGSDRERRATPQAGAEPQPRPDPEIEVPEVPADAAGAAIKRMFAKGKARKKEPPP